MKNETFDSFNEDGVLCLPNTNVLFANLKWNPHAVFEGVELNHLATSEESDGQFSYHLVRSAPN
ncbi:hypothetical protein [Enterococcus sp. AZ196]|uniref:hypothetical protein n=1 Tax=Enterococcus sp. AZ196 TaxID=2774659 RepID=UPI003D27A4EA